MKKHFLWLPIVAAAMIPAQKATAVEILSADELASHCVAFPAAADSTDGQYCIRYIQGFIDGAIATDLRVMMNIETESSLMDSIANRALRTRLPSRSDSQRAAGYAEFCLGDPVPLEEVVNKVVADLKTGSDAHDAVSSARDVVYDSLRKHYPCQED